MANELISATDIKILTGVRGNLDPDLLEPHIERMQLRDLKPLLHEDLYEELITQNNASTLTDLNTTLIDVYIKPFLAFSVFWERIPFIHFDLGNNGIQINNTNETEPATGNEVKQYQTDVEDLKNAQQQYLFRYLEDNSDDYPLYVKDDDGVDNNIAGGYIIYENPQVRRRGRRFDSTCSNCNDCDCTC